MDVLRTCTVCGEELTIDKFAKGNKNDLKHGRRYDCNVCKGIRVRANKYNISIERVHELLSNSKCNICEKEFKHDCEKHIDHDHKTGKVMKK